MELVILGSSIAAISAIETFRSINATHNITLVTKEPWGAYSRPLITEYLTNDKNYEDILYRNDEFFQKNQIKTIVNHSAIHIDTDLQLIKLNNGQNLFYDQLLIATGSTTKRPKIPGINRKGVYCFWTFDDAIQIANRAKLAETSVIIGAGLVGMSAAYSLSSLGLKTYIVEQIEQILPQSLDNTAAQIVQHHIEHKRLNVITGQRVDKIHGDSDDGFVTGITLANDNHIPCDLLITCTGVSPSIDFLQGSNIRTEMGILVNNHLQTNISNIYAAGDVVQPFDPVYQTNQVVANLPNAHEQGRIAGLNLAGLNKEYIGGISMTSMRYFGIPWVSVGAPVPFNESCHEIIGRVSKEHGIYEKILIMNDKIIGAIIVGDITQAGIITNLIKNQTNMGPYLSNLDNREQFFELIQRSLFHEELEGPSGHISWKKVIGSDQRYKKTIDKEEWKKKERNI